MFFQLLLSDGFVESLQAATWVVGALMVLALTLVFLLPKQAQRG